MKSTFDWRAFQLAWRMGYSIALPLVALALGGRIVDKRFNTSPLFLLIGIIFSIIISLVWLVRIVSPLIRDAARDDKTKH